MTMSHTLVLASVTAVLKNLLENGLVDRGITAMLGGDALVSTLPPDRIATGSEEKVQLNLFLYQINVKGLSPISRHAQVSGMPAGQGLPRSLELQYLLTAYGTDELQTEILLGYGLELFQDTPVLSTEALQKLLTLISSRGGGHLVSPARAALADPKLSQCIRRLKICPQAMQTEEMVNLWSAFQVSYRPSLVYQVTVELASSIPAEPGQ